MGNLKLPDPEMSEDTPLFERLVKLQLESSKQLKELGKNVLDLAQIVESHINRAEQESPIDSLPSTQLTASTTNPTSIPAGEGQISSEPANNQTPHLLSALLIDGNYRVEWAKLSECLFRYGITQASVPADIPSLVAAGKDLERFALFMIPSHLEHGFIYELEMAVRQFNPNAIFIGVTDSYHGQGIKAHGLWNFNYVVDTDNPVESIGNIIHDNNL